MSCRLRSIALYGHDEWSLYGLASILDLEKIPYRRLTQLGQLSPRELLVVAGGELTTAESLAIVERRALVLNGGPQFARAVGRNGRIVDRQPVTVPLTDGLWPAPFAARLRRFGDTAVTVPSAPVFALDRAVDQGAMGALLTPGFCQPAIVRLQQCIWSTLDIGAAFTRLLTESYVPEQADALVGLLSSTIVERSVQSLYYAAPDWARRTLQTICYARAQRRLRSSEWRPSDYPADDTGTVIIELLKSLLLMTSDAIVRLERWPAPFRCAALMTHDIEPSRYAYEIGLTRLLEQQQASDRPVFGLVSQAACRHLSGRAAARLRDYDVLCHGLTHRGDPISDAASLARRIGAARESLEQRLGRPIRGYRSPRLDRSRELLRALDEAGYEYDSSYPDSDRENLAHFGAGVRLNVPYRPPIEISSGKLRPSRCLELPLAAPDCIQPLFAGESQHELRRAVRIKSEFVRANRGLYVALVHAGVFGDDDAELREQHRRFVARRLRGGDTWQPSVGELLEWWRSREELEIRCDGEVLEIHNSSRRALAHVSAVIENGYGDQRLSLPAIEVGETMQFRLDRTARDTTAAGQVLQ